MFNHTNAKREYISNESVCFVNLIRTENIYSFAGEYTYPFYCAAGIEQVQG